MEKITINKYNKENAYKAFTSGKSAVAFYGNNYHGVIHYNDTTRTGTNGEYKWSVCAFGNMLAHLLYSEVIKEIYIVKPLNKNIFNTYDEMIQAVKENATHVIIKEEI